MPQPDLGPPETQVGGYLPYIDIPCERFVGESIAWVIFLSTTGPIVCTYIPWLCCPIPFEFNNTLAVSADVDCDEIGARYGATLFWTMQAVSIWGLILSMVNIVRCTLLLTVSKELQPMEVGIGTVPPPDAIEVSFDDKLLKGVKDKVVQLASGKTEKEEDFWNDLSVGRNNSEARAARKKRQTGFVGIDIPTLNPLYTGSDEKSDICDRDEILHIDGECHQILSQGPCEDTEIVLMDPQTKKGYCAPRLCQADRVFVYGDQKCHDPYENDICPPGRILFTSSVGSPVCGCPYGTYEEEDDLDEDVCEPVLGKLENCEPGQVFWFTSFRREPDCIPDPCKGLNANRGLNELAYVPSIFDGKCYQLGQELPQCPDDTFYTLSYTSLMGICASLETAGYTILDEDELESFSSLYGSRLPRDISSSLSSFTSSRSSFFSQSKKQRKGMPDVGSSAVIPAFHMMSNLLPMKIGQSVVHSHHNEDEDETSDVQVIPTHASAFSPTSLSFRSLSPLAKLFTHFFPGRKPRTTIEEENEEENKTSRKRRSVLSHASPETVFQSSFAACRAGARMGLNFKCNTKYLPNRLPLSRPKRQIPAISPYPPCPKGSLYSIKRTCVSNRNKVKQSMIAFGLG